MRCDQCEMLSINGVACHETGCPNTHSRYDVESESWIKQRKCSECGYTVDSDDPCCSAPDESIRFRNFYQCPECDAEWQDEYSCQVDDTCPECGARNISPIRSEDI